MAARKPKPINETNNGCRSGPCGVLGVRALNRALLARQMLLSRAKLSALEALEKLAGMQAQAPNGPYFSLWSRLQDFRQEELTGLLREKKAVRMALMRSTLHLVSARDALQLRPWLQPALNRSLNGAFGKQLRGIDLDRLAAAGRELVEKEPLTLAELGRRLREQWPELQADAAAAAIRNSVPLVQLPPRGLWGESGQAAHTSAEAWLGLPLSERPDAGTLVLRCLAAFGPASAKDIQTWSGLTRLTDTLDSLRPRLAAFRDERGVEMFDLPEAPRPDENTLCAPRFLGEFDNVLLSYADRSRILNDADRSRVITSNGIVKPTFLIDGFVAGTWSLQREKKRTALRIEPFAKLSQPDADALAEEGNRLLHFVAQDARDAWDHELTVRIREA